MAPRLKTTDTGNGEKYIPKLFRLILVLSPFPLCPASSWPKLRLEILDSSSNQLSVILIKMFPCLELGVLTQTTEALGTLCATPGTYTQ